MARAPFNADTDVPSESVMLETHPTYDLNPQPEVRTATLPEGDSEQDWTEVHPNGSREVAV